MKNAICLLVGLLALNVLPALGQPAPGNLPPLGPPAGFQQRLQQIVANANPDANPPALTKFSLDFPGGTATDLVRAIEKAMAKPLNVIINKEDEDVALPALKMNDVTLPQLFAALEATSRKLVSVASANFPNSYSQYYTSYGFKTEDHQVSDTSIWYFHVERPSLPPVVSNQKVCQFFSLSDYLNRGFTVDDITTAIQTGWKLSGETAAPELNYHKETKLLIAYGDPPKLRTIQQVLDALPSEKAVHTRSQMNDLNDKLSSLADTVKKIQEFEATQRKFNALVTNLFHVTVELPVTPEEKTGK
jgi:hypothetical protein